MELHNLPSNKNRIGTNILIVESDETNGALIRESLEPKGIHTLHARNARNGIEIYENHGNIKLILINIKLPDMDCFEAAIKMVASGGSAPMIFISGSSHTGNLTLVGKSDIIYDFIYETISLSDLTHMICKYLDGQHKMNTRHQMN